MVNYLSKSRLSYFQRRKNVHIYKGNFYLPKLVKPYLHTWLTTYPKAEFHISKEEKMSWKIDFQTWICSVQRWKAYFLNVDNQENLNHVECGKFLMISMLGWHFVQYVLGTFPKARVRWKHVPLPAMALAFQECTNFETHNGFNIELKPHQHIQAVQWSDTELFNQYLYSFPEYKQCLPQN